MAQKATTHGEQLVFEELHKDPTVLIGKTIVASGLRLVTDWPDEDWCHSPETHPGKCVAGPYENGNYVVKLGSVIGRVIDYDPGADTYDVFHEDIDTGETRIQQIPHSVMRRRLERGFRRYDTNGVPNGTDDCWWVE
jgi:hypothetical protein